jgi:hypothetical protein
MSDDNKTELEIAGMKFTGGKMFLVISALSTLGGGAWGAFEFYNDYRNMKAQIQEYVAPDLSGINERLTALDKKMEGIAANVQQSTDYTNEIKIDLKADIRRIEKVVENVERSTKEQGRQVDMDLKTARNEMRDLQKEVDRGLKNVRTDMEAKLKEALDNPLSQ